MEGFYLEVPFSTGNGCRRKCMGLRRFEPSQLHFRRKANYNNIVES